MFNSGEYCGNAKSREERSHAHFEESWKKQIFMMYTSPSSMGSAGPGLGTWTCGPQDALSHRGQRHLITSSKSTEKWSAASQGAGNLPEDMLSVREQSIWARTRMYVSVSTETVSRNGGISQSSTTLLGHHTSSSFTVETRVLETWSVLRARTMFYSPRQLLLRKKPCTKLALRQQLMNCAHHMQPCWKPVGCSG